MGLPNKVWLRIRLYYHRFRDWRIVIATDAAGAKRRCLLIPLEKNGIKELQDGRIIQNIMCLRVKEGQVLGNDKYAVLLPYINDADYAKLVEKGDGLPYNEYQVNERMHTVSCGFLMRPRY